MFICLLNNPTLIYIGEPCNTYLIDKCAKRFKCDHTCKLRSAACMVASSTVHWMQWVQWCIASTWVHLIHEVLNSKLRIQFYQLSGFINGFMFVSEYTIVAEYINVLKGSDRLCKVVELSMQCCGKLLSDSFETY